MIMVVVSTCAVSSEKGQQIPAVFQPNSSFWENMGLTVDLQPQSDSGTRDDANYLVVISSNGEFPNCTRIAANPCKNVDEDLRFILPLTENSGESVPCAVGHLAVPNKGTCSTHCPPLCHRMFADNFTIHIPPRNWTNYRGKGIVGIAQLDAAERAEYIRDTKKCPLKVSFSLQSQRFYCQKQASQEGTDSLR